jgi:orotidine-5'-phosphate decarboxylase
MFILLSMSDHSLLSTKPIAPSDRLIFALDVPTKNDALAWIDRLGDSVTFYKIGLELFCSGAYFELLETLRSRGKKVFADLKFFDIPATVRSAVANLAKTGATCCTVHGCFSIYREAVAAKGAMKLLAVTVLTSLDENDLSELGFNGKVEDLVVARAKRAFESGCDGVIASGHESPRLRREIGTELTIITPGIRGAEEQGRDDQKRALTLEQAFRNGADHVVVGRPIRNAPDPRVAAEAMQQEIARIFS